MQVQLVRPLPRIHSGGKKSYFLVQSNAGERQLLCMALHSGPSGTDLLTEHQQKRFAQVLTKLGRCALPSAAFVRLPGEWAPRGVCVGGGGGCIPAWLNTCSAWTLLPPPQLPASKDPDRWAKESEGQGNGPGPPPIPALLTFDHPQPPPGSNFLAALLPG